MSAQMSVNVNVAYRYVLHVTQKPGKESAKPGSRLSLGRCSQTAPSMHPQAVTAASQQQLHQEAQHSGQALHCRKQ